MMYNRPGHMQACNIHAMNLAVYAEHLASREGNSEQEAPKADAALLEASHKCCRALFSCKSPLECTLQQTNGLTAAPKLSKRNIHRKCRRRLAVRTLKDQCGNHPQSRIWGTALRENTRQKKRKSNPESKQPSAQNIEIQHTS
jgi:hypothetical protein